MTDGKRIFSYVIKGLILCIYAAGSLYLTFPALHFQNKEAAAWLISVILVGFLIFGCGKYIKTVFEGMFPAGVGKHTQATVKREKMPVFVKVLLVIVCVFGVYFVGGEISSMKVFRAKDYAAQMEMQEMEIKDF